VIRPVADFLIENAGTLVTPSGPWPVAGVTDARLTRLDAPVVAGAAGRIVWVGPAAHLAEHVEAAPRATRIDATGCSLVPGFVDASPPPAPPAGAPDPAHDWGLAHGTTTWLAVPRRSDARVLAPVDVLLRTGADLAAAAAAAGDGPVALTAVTSAGDGVQVSSMPYALALACLGLGLSFKAGLAAATLQAAWSLGCDTECGSLEAGKRLDVAIVEGAPERLVAAGAPAVRMVIRGGKLVNWV
jgi:imidazolonepropionase-like amidohydrolase